MACGRGPTSDMSPQITLMSCGQLVEAGLAQDAADGGDTRIIAGGLHDALAVLQHAHGAELEDRERPPAAAETFLAEEHGALGIEPDGERDGAEDGREQRGHGNGDGEVDDPLGQTLRTVERRALQLDCAHAAHVAHRHVQKAFEFGFGDQADGARDLLQALGQRRELFGRKARRPRRRSVRNR